MPKRLCILIAAGLTANAPPSLAQSAFGIDMGATARDLNILEKTEREGTITFYRVVPPVINPEFQYYFAFVDDAVGACKLMAFSEGKPDDADGQKVVAAFYSVATILAKKYGKGTPLTSDVKNYRPGSNDFADQLDKDEIHISVSWDFEPDTPGDLSRIMLFAHADGPATTSLVITYDFKNAEECKSV